MIETEVLQSINPATEEVIAAFDYYSDEQIEKALNQARAAFESWRKSPFRERSRLMNTAARYLRENQSRLAGLMTAEMGKPITQSEAEIEKCAWNCDYFAQNAEAFLAPQPRSADSKECYVEFIPLGPILAIMPWNFPFWQVIRFAAPALMAGNAVLLKHAPNVAQCALAAEEIFRESGFPPGLFQTLFIPVERVKNIIEDGRIAGVTLTGSVRAGREVGSQAGRAIKKCVLELGGSDPFIVLDDADIEKAVEVGVQARFQNTGQSCIAAKRFILVDPIYDEYCNRFVQRVRELKMGDPTDRDTQIGPLARGDLRENLEKQVQKSISQGARILAGGERPAGKGFYYKPTVLEKVEPETTAATEEVFGPVAALMNVRDADEAIGLANDSAYGLGANLWTRDFDRARELAARIQAGQVTINGMVASDPRLPFGGVKSSGYGRELSEYGIREFVNIQAVCIQ